MSGPFEPMQKKDAGGELPTRILFAVVRTVYGSLRGELLRPSR